MSLIQAKLLLLTRTFQQRTYNTQSYTVTKSFSFPLPTPTHPLPGSLASHTSAVSHSTILGASKAAAKGSGTRSCIQHIILTQDHTNTVFSRYMTSRQGPGKSNPRV
jgi:hypothetical protein